MLYREANLFLEHHDEPGSPLAPEDLEDLEPELDAQLTEVLRTCDHLEDLVKHSVLRAPPLELAERRGVARRADQRRYCLPAQ